MNIDSIFKDVSKVISYSQNITNPKIDYLKNEWLTKKEKFINMFDGELIYEFPEIIHFELSKEEKEKRLNDFIETIIYYWDNKDLAEFIDTIKPDFFKNTTSISYKINNVTIPKGMKIVKAFKFFEKNQKLLEEIQNYASRILQENKVEGKLCLSVHPLDYLSSSENTYNWRSCHSLDGEYRAGNLSYMTDSSTIICYLKSSADKKFKLPNFPEDVLWNSKKWRMLLFFSSDMKMVFAGRQYPFTSNNGLSLVLDKLQKLTPYYWKQWDNTSLEEVNKVQLNKKYIILNNELFPIKNIISDFPNSKHYNDLLHSSYYKPYYSTVINYDFKPSNIVIGDEVTCICCGKNIVNLEDTMLCDNCELQYGECNDESIVYCECCNRRLFREDAIQINLDYCDNEYICQYCAETIFRRCNICGKLVYKDETIYDKNEDCYVCLDCNGG